MTSRQAAVAGACARARGWRTGRWRSRWGKLRREHLFARDGESAKEKASVFYPGEWRVSIHRWLALSESFTNYLLDDEQNYHLQVEALWLVLQVIRGASPGTSCHRPRAFSASSPTESWKSLTACSRDRRQAVASTITRCMGAALNTSYSAAR